MHRPANKFLRLLHELYFRLHTFIVMVLVGWAGCMAVLVLFRTVFSPPQVPERFLQVPSRLDARDLYRETPYSIRTAAKRPPLAHYHAVDRWISLDPYNGCTTQGCHSPMPHQKNRGIRSFNNFHATFLACTLCHETKTGQPVRLRWFSLETGRLRSPPALLQLLEYLELSQEEIRREPEAAQRVIQSNLQGVLRIVGENMSLNHLSIRLNTAEPGSPFWWDALADLKNELPRHVRGEYGAKLVPLSSFVPDYRQWQDEIKKLAQEYLAADALDYKANLRRQVHRYLNSEPLLCTACHVTEHGVVEFEGLGYSPSHVASLRHSLLAREMQSIQQGEEFFITPHPRVQP